VITGASGFRGFCAFRDQANPSRAVSVTLFATRDDALHAHERVAAPRVVDAAWSFRAEEPSCVAAAAHPALALTIAVRDRRSVEVALRLGAGARPGPRAGGAVPL
jgi:hypothetical protein